MVATCSLVKFCVIVLIDLCTFIVVHRLMQDMILWMSSMIIGISPFDGLGLIICAG